MNSYSVPCSKRILKNSKRFYFYVNCELFFNFKISFYSLKTRNEIEITFRQYSRKCEYTLLKIRSEIQCNIIKAQAGRLKKFNVIKSALNFILFSILSIDTLNLMHLCNLKDTLNFIFLTVYNSQEC